MEELIHSFRHDRKKVDIQKQFINQPEQGKALLHYGLSHQTYPLPEYASWLMVHIQKTDATYWVKYQQLIIDFLLLCENHSVRRNLLNILYLQPYSFYRADDYLDTLIRLIQDPQQKVAVHVYAIYCTFPFLEKYPELNHELVSIIQLKQEKEGLKPALKIAYKKLLHFYPL